MTINEMSAAYTSTKFLLWEKEEKRKTVVVVGDNPTLADVLKCECDSLRETMLDLTGKLFGK